jgi:DNA-binding NarL/FixJ family response regulator
VSRFVTDCCPGVVMVGDAKTTRSCFKSRRGTRPEVVLIDLNMPCEGALETDEIHFSYTNAACSQCRRGLTTSK